MNSPQCFGISLKIFFKEQKSLQIFIIHLREQFFKSEKKVMTAEKKKYTKLIPAKEQANCSQSSYSEDKKFLVLKRCQKQSVTDPTS